MYLYATFFGAPLIKEDLPRVCWETLLAKIQRRFINLSAEKSSRKSLILQYSQLRKELYVMLSSLDGVFNSMETGEK